MASNLHQVKSLCFVFDAENDLILLQHMGTGKYARKHTGIVSDCNFNEEMATATTEGIKQQSGLETSGIKLRGVIKELDLSEDEASIFFVYEAEYIHGELEQNAYGRLKWVEVLNVFNLKFTPQVSEIISYLLDGESFFEAFFESDENGELINKQVHVR